MATISRLEPGQVLYQVKRQKCGNTTIHRNAIFTVRVVSIAEDGKSIMASWNGNSATKWRSGEVAKLRVKRPEINSKR